MGDTNWVLGIERGDGEHYRVNAAGEISRRDPRPNGPWWVPSGDWRICGAVERTGFCVRRRFTWEEIRDRPETIPWLNKDGSQRTFIQDQDHGTFREWQSPTARCYPLRRKVVDRA